MRFEDWVERERGEVSRTEFLRSLADSSGVSLQTLQFVVRGGKISLYRKAKIISDATEGLVSIEELCG